MKIWIFGIMTLSCGLVLALEPGFVSLFDGVQLDGWKQDGNWSVIDGVISRTKKGGSLVYEKEPVPDDFELRFDWKVAQGCNSGVYYRPGQYEYQLLDDANSPYGENPRQAAASLFFCMAPNQDATRAFGEWNEGRIVCKGSVIQHWLNGRKVIDFDYTDPRWHSELEVLRLRGGDLTRRGAHISLQDHGADVFFKNLRWRVIPPEEVLESENLPSLPIPDSAIRKEQGRLNGMIKPFEKQPWQHQELRRFPAEEAHQGVAVDGEHFYAITNRAIGKYEKSSGTRVGGWQGDAEGTIIHLNAGVVLDGKLYCAHSNYPQLPMRSSVEVWDAESMQHLQSHDLSAHGGSLTWVDRRDGWWYACFAMYASSGDPAATRVLRFDLHWQPQDELFFPPEMVQRFGKHSSSGGSFGPERHLFVTGHDAQELYVLSQPVSGHSWDWRQAIPISAHGQAFAWDRAEPGILYSIDRKTREVIVSRIQRAAPQATP